MMLCVFIELKSVWAHRTTEHAEFLIVLLFVALQY